MRALVAAACVLALGAAPATAVGHSPIASSACEPGASVYKVSKGVRAHKVTHVNTIKVAAKKTRTVTRPAPVVRTIKAVATGSGEFDATAILAAAHARYLKNEDAVRAPGDTTSGDPAELPQAKLRNPTTQPQEYAGYQAATVWKGKWTLQHCGDPAVHAKGSWRTFGTVKVSGYALCPASRYEVGSASFQACKQAWD